MNFFSHIQSTVDKMPTVVGKCVVCGKPADGVLCAADKHLIAALFSGTAPSRVTPVEIPPALFPYTEATTNPMPLEEHSDTLPCGKQACLPCWCSICADMIAGPPTVTP